MITYTLLNLHASANSNMWKHYIAVNYHISPQFLHQFRQLIVIGFKNLVLPAANCMEWTFPLSRQQWWKHLHHFDMNLKRKQQSAGVGK